MKILQNRLFIIFILLIVIFLITTGILFMYKKDPLAQRQEFEQKISGSQFAIVNEAPKSTPLVCTSFKATSINLYDKNELKEAYIESSANVAATNTHYLYDIDTENPVIGIDYREIDRGIQYFGLKPRPAGSRLILLPWDNSGTYYYSPTDKVLIWQNTATSRGIFSQQEFSLCK